MLARDRPKPKDLGFCIVRQKRLWYQQGLLPQPRTKMCLSILMSVSKREKWNVQLRSFSYTQSIPPASAIWCQRLLPLRVELYVSSLGM